MLCTEEVAEVPQQLAHTEAQFETCKSNNLPVCATWDSNCQKEVALLVDRVNNGV